MQSMRLSLAKQAVDGIFPCLWGFDSVSDEPPAVEEEDGTEATGGAGADEKERDPQKKIAALEEEKNRHYAARQEAEKELADLRKFKSDKEREAGTEVENLRRDVEERDEVITALSESNKTLILENAFLKDETHKWHNPQRALSLVDLSDIEIERGKVKNPDALAKAIKDLATSDPYLLKTVSDDDKDQGAPKSGQPPVRKPGAKETPEQRRRRLEAKYPALRQH